jgi:hypothetical protein
MNEQATPAPAKKGHLATYLTSFQQKMTEQSSWGTTERARHAARAKNNADPTSLTLAGEDANLHTLLDNIDPAT